MRTLRMSDQRTAWEWYHGIGAEERYDPNQTTYPVPVGRSVDCYDGFHCNCCPNDGRVCCWCMEAPQPYEPWPS